MDVLGRVRASECGRWWCADLRADDNQVTHPTEYWLASIIDSCNNAVSAVQTISLRDRTAPEWDSFPADFTAECGAPIDPAHTGGSPTVVEACSAPQTVTLSHSDRVVPQECAGNYNVIRTWTTTDEYVPLTLLLSLCLAHTRGCEWMTAG